MQILRWRNVSLLKNSLISSKFTTTHFALFHSTPTSFDKRKTKRNGDIKGSQKPKKNIYGGQLSAKDYVKYTIRQKRSDTKKALSNFKLKYGSANILEEEKIWKIVGQTEKPGNSFRKHRPKSSTPHAEKGRQKKTKRKFKNDGFCEDFDEHPEPLFQAAFGNRCYTSSFYSSRASFSQNSTFKFEWTEHLNGKHKSKTWRTISDTESDDESYTVGSCSDRTILGLPPAGPLKIDDVKKAFRLSALKWHPDKHQGPSQATAEAKFKVCVNAYKSLCNALSPN